ncbi:MAG: C4-dicarboxylate transporter DcuC [Gemmataceae bacterium]
MFEFILPIGIIVAAVLGVIRGVEVRLVLFVSAILLGLCSGDPAPVIREFLTTLANEKFVVPICSAMGFAYVLRHTGCDQHLVQLLTSPVRRVKPLVLPGVVLVGFIVNIPVISQTSTAVCLGPVVVPLLRAAGFRAATIGACLLLGASMGGELFNPGAPELLTVSARTKKDTRELVGTIVPLMIPYALAATVVFWTFAARRERKPAESESTATQAQPQATDCQPVDSQVSDTAPFRINFFKALVPLVPIMLLFLAGPPWNVLSIPQRWMIPYPSVEASSAVTGSAAAIVAERKLDVRTGSRLIGLAMLVGVGVATLASPRQAKDSMKEFFTGAGYGYANIISLIVVANAFGKGIEQAGLARALGSLIQQAPHWLVPLAAIVPCAFALISGSGMASTQSLYGFFHTPAVELGVDPSGIGAVVSVASAAGRTMSPVSAVTLMCATLSGTKPWELVRLVAPPLIVGLIVAVALRMMGLI